MNNRLAVGLCLDLLESLQRSASTIAGLRGQARKGRYGLGRGLGRQEGEGVKRNDREQC